MTKSIAFFSTKPHDRAAFAACCPSELEPRWIEPRLDGSSAALAEGCVAAVAFVNDRADAAAIATLRRSGVGLLALRCAGCDNVDLAAARATGLVVSRVPSYSPHAVAEHAFALLLTLVRRTHLAWHRVREGDFRLDGLTGFDLHGRTIAILGVGQIGRCAIRIAGGFGLRVLAFDQAPEPALAAELGFTYAPLERCLAAADIVSLHLPLNPGTRQVIAAPALAAMRRGALLVNTGRGGLVAGADLLTSLLSGHLGGAALDVYEHEAAYFFEDHRAEPIQDAVLSRLLALPNVLVTGHQAFLTQEAMNAIAATTWDAILAHLAGRRPEHAL